MYSRIAQVTVIGQKGGFSLKRYLSSIHSMDASLRIPFQRPIPKRKYDTKNYLFG
jgi:hypothetical protein